MVNSHTNEFGTITSVLLRHAKDAFGSSERIGDQWQDLNYTAQPDSKAAQDEYAAFVSLIERVGCDVHYLPADNELTLDSIYVRDAAFPVPGGMVLCNMGKPARKDEPEAIARYLDDNNIPVKGFINGNGRLEGGDIIWLDDRSVVVGEGYRSNASGIAQLKDYLGDSVDDFIVVPLPHWDGPSDVFHLMSMISPIDKDLAVVYSKPMVSKFRNQLIERGIELVEVPDEEFYSMGCNVLAIAPREVIMIAGNPITRHRLEAANVTVHEYKADEISLKGLGGPTCLTRPLTRS
jgi:N-dimethylarginine dimethylaminohydrolase